MARIEDELLKEFFAELERSDEVTQEMADRLHHLLTHSEKLKADDFVQVFKTASEGEVL